MTESYRQNVLWLPPLRAASVGGAMDDERTEYQKQLGATLLALRVEQGPGLAPAILNQTDLGKRVGVSAATVARWEKGEGVPDGYELRLIAGIFEVEPSELLFPTAMSARERQVLRRAGRQLRHSVAQDLEAV